MHEFDISDLRRFVLGDLEEKRRRRIEAEALADNELFDEIEALEDEMIVEYLSGTLAASERKLFDESLDRVAGRRRRVGMVQQLSAKKPAELESVAQIKDRIRFANHARFAIAAGFAAAAVTAVAFFQFRSATTDPTPAVAATSSPAAPLAELTSVTAAHTPETSSAGAVHRPGSTVGAPLAPPVAKAAVPVVTFLLAATTARSDGASSPALVIGQPESLIDFQIAIDDDEFSHYNAEIRASDGSTVSAHRDVPVTALQGAPVLRLEVPATSLQAGRYELVLAGIHERGSEEVAYLEFDVKR